MYTWCLWRPEGEFGSPGTRVTDDVGAESGTYVLWKRNGGSELLSYLKPLVMFPQFQCCIKATFIKVV